MMLYWTFNILFLFLIIYFLSRRFNRGELKYWFYPALAFRLAAGIAVGLVYFYYYKEGDTIRFHKESVTLYHYGKEHFWPYISFIIKGGINHPEAAALQLNDEPRTLFFIKFLSLVNWFTGGSYWINALFLSLLSFIGSWVFIVGLSGMNRKFTLPALASFGFLPTMVFWSSGVLKESLAVCCTGIMMSLFIRYFIFQRTRIAAIIFFIFLSWITWEIKYYQVAVLLAAMMAVIVSEWVDLKLKFTREPVIMVVIFLAFLLAGSLVHPNFSLHRIIGVLHENHEKIIAISNHRNVVPFIPYGSPGINFLINMPVSVFAGLFMPLPFQGKGFIVAGPGIVNLFVLLTTVFLLYRRVSLPSGKLQYLIFGSLLYILTLSVLLSYSTPNFGTLERYKVTFLPLYFFLILAGIKSGGAGTEKLAGNI